MQRQVPPELAELPLSRLAMTAAAHACSKCSLCMRMFTNVLTELMFCR